MKKTIIKKFFSFLFIGFLLATFFVFDGKDVSAVGPSYLFGDITVKNITTNKGTFSGIVSGSTSAEEDDVVQINATIIHAGAATNHVLKLTESLMNYVPNTLKVTTVSPPADVDYAIPVYSGGDDDSDFIGGGASFTLASAGQFYIRFNMTVPNLGVSSITTYQPYITLTGDVTGAPNLIVSIKTPMAVLSSASDGNQTMVVTFQENMKNDANLNTNSSYYLSKNGGLTFPIVSTGVVRDSATQVTLTFPVGTFSAGDSLALRMTNLLTDHSIELENNPSTTNKQYDTLNFTAADTTPASILSAIYYPNEGANGKLKIIFNESMTTGDVSNANVATKITVGGKTLGISPTVGWNQTTYSADTLTITLGAGKDIVTGDTITIGTPVKDMSNNDSNGKTKVIAPSVSDVTSSTANGTYKLGDIINIQVNFTGNVILTGTPTLILETGATDRTVNCSDGPGNSITCAYTVQAGDVSSDLDYTLTTALSGTIKDALGNSADINLPTVGGSNSLAGNQAIVIDGIVPVVTVNTLATLDTTPTLTGTVDDDAATISITVDGNVYLATNNGATWTLADNTITPALPGGTYNITVTATNVTGNIGTDTTTGELMICNSGYTVSGNTCVAPSTGGGGGGGGSIGPDTKTVYILSNSESDVELELIRPIKTKDGIFRRPILLKDYYYNSWFRIQKWMKVTNDNTPFLDQIDPIGKTPIMQFTSVELPDESLVYKHIFTIGGEGVLYSDPINGELVLPAPLKKFTEDYKGSYKIMYWIPKGKLNAINTGLVASTGEEVEKLEGKWELFGGPEKVNDGKISFSLDHSTYFAFVSSSGEELDIDIELLSVSESGMLKELTDIESHWAKDYILELYNKGVVKGKGDTKMFFPDESINRADFTKIVMNLFEYDLSKVDTSNNPFTDVPSDSWFTPYVLKAYEEGIIKGYEKGGKILFKPEQNINRAEALILILKAAGIDAPDDTTEEFDDVPRGIWFEKYVAYAYKNGVVKGKLEGIFDPQGNITRAEAVKIALKLFNLK